ncbi:MAG: ferric reductase-like transmembrane domain-containing protein [Thermoleophilaceae bacterium]
MTHPDPAKYVWWLASRSAGIVALILVSTSVLIGLAMATRLIRRRGATRALLRVHEQTALAGLGALAVHGLTLLGDGWLRPGLTGVAVPFAMSYRPFYTGLGILAAYLAALLGLSFYARRHIGARLWRKAHRATVLVWVLGVVHTLGAGTDAGSAWLRAIVLAPLPLIAGLFAYRTLGGRPGLSGRLGAGLGSR